jgi:glutaredoxin-like protein
MARLTPDEKAFMNRELEKIQGKLKINVHLPSGKCESCEDLKGIMEELVENRENIGISMIEEDSAEDGGFDYILDRLPAVVVLDGDGNDHGMVFYGNPSSNLFRAFIWQLLNVSGLGQELDEDTIAKIKELGKVELQVLVTPSTPKCAETIKAAQSFALASSDVRTSVIELIEFPEIAERYEVLGLPKTIVNEELKFTGTYDAGELLEIIRNRISDVEE